jgi:hypothetical protein
MVEVQSSEVVQYLRHSAVLNNGLGWVSTADVTMKTMACGFLYSKSDIKA